ncbi:FAD linked oxidase domain protein [Gemmatirosa kalamazoonensis]|uniref:FAD linked oxidase domain protein n=1 Tax=Gemmatirosa kalamazoonensis TaxID=861299 RepID=W0RFM0_9BACT|nr:FAD-binding oxidoreductase [Gemmatirosa kalamazoonensis]AHG89899.1 FAD linked oxidase domain protein [Gemmatirosa kalamazoonensis]
MSTVTPPADFRGTFRDDLPARAVYAEGAGIARCVPAAVAVPGDAADVERLVQWASTTGTPLVPRGSGSGMAGGAVGAGVVVDLSRLAAIGAVDVAARRVSVGPGAVRGAVEAAARAVGLTFPPDPSSSPFCTLGGMAGTNAAGARTMRFGATRRWVAALDCVFADGSRAVVRRGAPPPDVAPVRRFLAEVAPSLVPNDVPRHAVRKESSGYALADYAASGDLVDLLVGSEGTLALFVGLELALAPAPAATSGVLAAYATLEGAVAGAALARGAGASACELLDRTFLDVAASGATDADAHALPTVPDAAESVILVELEGASVDGARDAARALADALGAAGALDVQVALDAAGERALWALRHAASPILSRLDPSLKSMQFIEDGTVPPDRLPDYVRGVRAALARQGIRGVIFGHAGDANVHVNPLVDLRDPDWRARVAALLDEVTALVARLGGTLSGEHGDGRLRTPLLDRVWDADALALFAAVKRAFDPQGILNPGVKVALPGQAPIDDVKYDRSLPPLPADARAALDRVADRREYARFRLELLRGGMAG